jgi:hypothetical protein
MQIRQVHRVTLSEDGFGFGQPESGAVAIADDGSRSPAGVISIPQVHRIARSEEGFGQPTFSPNPTLRVTISEDGFGQEIE